MVVEEEPGQDKNGVGPIPGDFCRVNAMVRNWAIDNSLTHTFFLLDAEVLAFADLAFFPVTLVMQ
jgi:hypothetical protein